MDSIRDIEDRHFFVRSRLKAFHPQITQIKQISIKAVESIEQPG